MEALGYTPLLVGTLCILFFAILEVSVVHWLAVWMVCLTLLEVICLRVAEETVEGGCCSQQCFIPARIP